MGSYVVAIREFTVANTVLAWLNSWLPPVAWDGTGEPWLTLGSSPFEIAKNSVTGPRFGLTPPTPAATLDGSAPFIDWSEAVAVGRGNRTIVVPLQANASDVHRPRLLGVLRAAVNRITSQSYLEVGYTTPEDGYQASRTVRLPIISGTVEENPLWSSDEVRTDLIRITLTLECQVGSGAPVIAAQGSKTNATAWSLGTIAGDRRASGQPLFLEASGGNLTTFGTKRIYAATCSNAASGSLLSESLATSSAAGVQSTGVTSLLWQRQRTTRLRLLAAITSPSSNLEVQGVAFWGTSASSGALYTGPWVAPGTNTTLIDLGYVSRPSVAFLSGNPLNTRVRIRYRSTNGGATSGTLTRIYALVYYTFCVAATPPGVSTNGGTHFWLASDIPPNTIDFGRSRQGAWFADSGSITGALPLRGQAPLAIENTSIWLAWMHNGVFSAADTASVGSTIYPLYETVYTGQL